MRQRHRCIEGAESHFVTAVQDRLTMPFDGSEKTSWPLGSCLVACDWETCRWYPWLMFFSAVRHVGQRHDLSRRTEYLYLECFHI